MTLLGLLAAFYRESSDRIVNDDTLFANAKIESRYQPGPNSPTADFVIEVKRRNDHQARSVAWGSLATDGTILRLDPHPDALVSDWQAIQRHYKKDQT